MANVMRKNRADFPGWPLRRFSGSNGSRCTVRRWSGQSGANFRHRRSVRYTPAHRSYKEALSFDASIESIWRDHGTNFDLQLPGAFAHIARPCMKSSHSRRGQFASEIETLLARDLV
jgi:hypothetical protein